MFDTPSRDICSPRRIATNTPLQALVTLNSEVYTELAGKLAERCMVGKEDPEAVISEMFCRVASRQPSDEDLADLTALFRYLDTETDPTIAGNKENERDLSPLGVVALAILNSDWAITK